MSSHLSDDEIASITKPLTQGAARIKYFRRLGVRAEARPNGQPLVLRIDFERRRQEAANDSRKAAPDWTEFEKRVRYGRDGEKAEGRKPARA
jgi:hypothetical protein